MDAAVQAGDVRRTTEKIKNSLIECSRDASLLAEIDCRRSAGHYARRLLHRNASLGYTMVVMTWGPGQSTELHDHAGIWCVECVLDGRLDVTQYDLVDRQGERYRFEQRKRVQADVGNAGCLIPPFEYHVLGNALSHRDTVTLHVYGGEMDSCNLYHERPGGWWEKTPKPLVYD